MINEAARSVCKNSSTQRVFKCFDQTPVDNPSRDERIVCAARLPSFLSACPIYPRCSQVSLRTRDAEQQRGNAFKSCAAIFASLEQFKCYQHQNQSNQEARKFKATRMEAGRGAYSSKHLQALELGRRGLIFIIKFHFYRVGIFVQVASIYLKDSSRALKLKEDLRSFFGANIHSCSVISVL